MSGGVGDVVAAATQRKRAALELAPPTERAALELAPPTERAAYHCANASPIEVPLIVVRFQGLAVRCAGSWPARAVFLSADVRRPFLLP